MKYVMTFALMGLLGIASIGYSQEIPDGVKKYMHQLQNDPEVEFGFNSAKEWGFIDSDVPFEDWFVGLPFQYYDLTLESIEMATKDSNFEDLINPTNKWCIPVKINGYGYAYHVLVKVKEEMFKPAGCGEGVLGKRWNEVRRKFPEQSGVVPGYIEYPHDLLYFPHIKNGKNIFHVTNPKWDTPMSRATSKSLDSLDDGNTIIPLLKDKIKRYKEQRKELDQRKREYKQRLEKSQDKSGGKK